MPILDDDHWSLIALFSEKRELVYYNSFRAENIEYRCMFLSYLRKEVKQTGADFSISSLKSISGSCPEQRNSTDCGIFMLKAAEYLSR